MRTEEEKTRSRLRRKAYRLAQETYDRDVSYERLVVIRDRLVAIDNVLSTPVAQLQGSRLVLCVE